MMRRKLPSPFLAVFGLAAAALTPPCASAGGVRFIPSFRTEEAVRRPARPRLKIRTGAAEEDASSHFDQGIAHTASGESETAAASLREAVRLRPALALAHYNLGYAPSLPERWPDAEAACREAIRLQPDPPEAHFIIALALAQAGGYEDAISS